MDHAEPGLPAALGALVTWSWWGGLTALFWAGLVRVSLLHHVTWSVNSICHMIRSRPFTSRDKAANFWPLALLSMGEPWHNSHHADPTCVRHGMLPGQIDVSARLIWVFEKIGWVWQVRWLTPHRRACVTDRSGQRSPRGGLAVPGAHPESMSHATPATGQERIPR